MPLIQPRNNNGSIVLRFTVATKRYCLGGLGRYDDPVALGLAQATAARIALDIRLGVFDPTLGTYRPSTPAVTAVEPLSLLNVYDRWVVALGLPEATQANDYRSLRSLVAKATDQGYGLSDTVWLSPLCRASSTFNKRLGYMRSFGAWLVDQGLAEVNAWRNVKRRSKGATSGLNKGIRPFTRSEVAQILAKISRAYPGYYPFVAFLFGTGVRTAEAIGLRWGNVDLAKGTVRIAESLPKDRMGNGYQRVSKGTKTGSVRVIPLSPKLVEVLQTLHQGDCQALVFTTATGKAISGDNFRERVWRSVLKTLGIEYRRVYETRHTFASHAIDQGIPVTEVAYLLGHTDATMVTRVYGRMVRLPRIPELI